MFYFLLAERESEELEEELKSLLEDSAPDTSLTLPEIPHHPVSTKNTSVLDDAFFHSLPSVPDNNITDEELERELGRLSLCVSFLFHSPVCYRAGSVCYRAQYIK